jgi:hypothetical protein
VVARCVAARGGRSGGGKVEKNQSHPPDRMRESCMSKACWEAF